MATVSACVSPREESGAVRAREDAHLARNRAYFGEGASIGGVSQTLKYSRARFRLRVLQRLAR